MRSVIYFQAIVLQPHHNQCNQRDNNTQCTSSFGLIPNMKVYQTCMIVLQSARVTITDRRSRAMNVNMIKALERGIVWILNWYSDEVM
jgi:hypothetical protein